MSFQSLANTQGMIYIGIHIVLGFSEISTFKKNGLYTLKRFLKIKNIEVLQYDRPGSDIKILIVGKGIWLSVKRWFQSAKDTQNYRPMI